MFPEPTPLEGKRLIPRLAVGCLVFALVGVLGTLLIGRALTPFFSGDKAKFAQEAAARERSDRR